MALRVDLDLTGTEEGGLAVQELAEFEPDPAGDGSTQLDPAPACDTADDPQWIVWSDADEEAVWAAVELTQIGAGWHV
jgi:hypothetical protein